jgi:4-oxalocrotonate tautomerase
MPIGTVQVTREGTAPGAECTTPEQKAKIFKGVANLMHEVLGKHPDDTWIIFQEVETENWAGVDFPSPSTARPSPAPARMLTGLFTRQVP